jgi:hypothetical protein
MKKIIKKAQYKLWRYSQGLLFGRLFVNAVFQFEDYRGRVYAFPLEKDAFKWGFMCRDRSKNSKSQRNWLYSSSHCLGYGVNPYCEIQLVPDYVLEAISPYKPSYRDLDRLVDQAQLEAKRIQELEEILEHSVGSKKDFYQGELNTLREDFELVTSAIVDFEAKISAAFLAIEELRSSVEFIEPDGYAINSASDLPDLGDITISTGVLSEVKADIDL